MSSVVGLTEILQVSVTPTPGAVQDANTKQVNGSPVDTGVGASGAGTQRVAISSDSQITAVFSGTPNVTVTNFPATQTVSGTVAATQSGTWNINSITTLPSLPAGANAIGSVSVSNFPATQAVSGTVAATQSGTWNIGSITTLPSLSAGTNAIGSVSVSNFPATQAVSGTVAATQSGTWNIGSITTLPSLPAGTNAIGSVSVSNFPATQAVSGTVTANAGTGSFTVAQATAANLNATVTGTVAATQSGTWNIGSITTLPSLPAGANAIGSVSVSNFPATQTVSGTVSTKTALTANSPTFATVGVTSAQAVAANSNRKGLVLTNNSTANISLAFGATAVAGSGIVLYPGGVFYMDEYMFTTAAVNAIATAAASNLGVQEWQ